ncbi:MAG: carboxypeptidase-like regulatory domain-containing protein, partial [Ignavibacteria bacterium]
MKRKIFTVLSILLILTSMTMGQTGRISGRVTDIQTQEPLIGANVLIIGSNMGAATDVNGIYTILNVPVGEYNLKASYIGYQEVTIQKIRITSGLTEEVNFNLPSESIATEEVIIVAEKPLIEKSATNAIRIISSDDVANLPTRNLNEIVALQPGVVRQNEQTFIRGSRADETGYIIEGADVKNILSREGGAMVTVTPDALHEVLVQAGGYTAEYGNANAGIIQSDFKTGTDLYHFSLRAETDNFGNANSPDKILGTYSYGYSDYVITASGPLFSNKLKLFLSGENFFTRDYDPMFYSGNPAAFSDGALLDTTKVYDSGLYGGSTSDYQYLKWDGGSVPGRMLERFTFNGTALLDLKPLMIKFSSAFSVSQKRANDNDFVYVNNDIPDILDISNLYNLGRLPVQDLSSLLLNLKGTYFLLDNTFIEANVNFLDSRQKIYDPYYEDDYLAYNDSLKGSQFGWVYDDYTTPPNAYDFYGFPFARPGDLTTNYTKDYRYYLGGSLALTSQIENHALKAGGSYQRWTIRRYQVIGATSMLNLVRQNPDLSRNADSLQYLFQNQGFTLFNNYGYDLLGNSVDSGPYAPKNPVFASAYVEDKLELNDIIINAGLRFDYIDMDSWSWV